MAEQIGSIAWEKRVEVGTKHSAWYDHTFYEVPFKGPYEHSRIQQALIMRLSRQFLSKFGGQFHIGEVDLAREGVLKVETLYSIGD
jgi:hypothetical protein